MFRGSSFHTIDPKGRLIIPSRFRELIRSGGGNGVMVSRLDGGLVAYPYNEWTKIETRILALAEKNEYMRRFRRIFIGGASECPYDKQHRILIPQPLREYAGVEKDIVLVGVLDHFEIWSKEKWDIENQTLEEDLKTEELRNEVAKLGI